MGTHLSSKRFWGLGITNTRFLNEALLLKWIWRLYNGGEDDLCCQLLRAKYLRNKPLALSKGKKGSQFWTGIQKIRAKFNWGATFILGDGKSILFWEDVLVGNTPLRLQYPKLYGCCANKNARVSECWVAGEWKIQFHRSFGHAEIIQWEHLLQSLSQLSILESRDQARWALESKGMYSTRSMYRMLSNRGVENRRMKLLWESKLPLKIKVFMWLAL